MDSNSLTVRVQAYDRVILKTLFGNDSPQPNAQTTIDGIELEFGGVARRHGMSSEDIVITILLNVGTGIPTSVLANWIYKRLTDGGRQAVQIGSDPIVKTKEAEIAEALSKPK